ncbi:LOW QUALITY PROTEIN: hypothetical protein PoB_003675300 [Plakobranchus ocellatus]|uniref:Uncharacterized protein n=1 Tax=Plakobranchus ocellatus TaxID=259542 RepID=A0AAV4ATV6_9GAST|nr:LOW QUALITY PROTEIN: hypothetical protein PoB_003675300 [Plakobranchus ocellatus]
MENQGVPARGLVRGGGGQHSRSPRERPRESGYGRQQHLGIPRERSRKGKYGRQRSRSPRERFRGGGRYKQRSESSARGLVRRSVEDNNVQEAPGRGLVKVGTGHHHQISRSPACHRSDQKRNAKSYRRDCSQIPIYQRRDGGHRGVQSQMSRRSHVRPQPAPHGGDKGLRRGHNGSARRPIHD